MYSKHLQLLTQGVPKPNDFGNNLDGLTEHKFTYDNFIFSDQTASRLNVMNSVLQMSQHRNKHVQITVEIINEKT